MRRELPLSAFLFAFAVFLPVVFVAACDSSSGDGDANVGDDAGPDDDASPDDDSPADDDDTSPPSLNLPDFPGDGDLYGVACSHPSSLMTATGWQEIDQPVAAFETCRAVDPGATVFFGRNDASYVVGYSRYDGEWTDLQCPPLTPDNYYSPMPGRALSPFLLIGRDSGVLGEYVWASGVWTYHAELMYSDAAALDDGVVVGPELACLYRWNGAAGDEIACLPDAGERLGQRTPALPIRQVRYFAVDDIWVILQHHTLAPVVFLHWNGVEWDQSFRFDDGGYDEYYLDWVFADPEHGWAIGSLVDYGRTRSRAAEYADGEWRLIEIPAPDQPEYGDRCSNPTAVSAHELWVQCVRQWQPDWPPRYEYYFVQRIDGECAYWRSERGEWLADLDLRRISLDPRAKDLRPPDRRGDSRRF